MYKSKPNGSVIYVAIILSLSVGLSMLMHPETLSMEPFMLAAIAAMLSGIWSELHKMNNMKRVFETQSLSEND